MNRASLTPPGQELARLQVDSGEVGALALLPDGRLALAHMFDHLGRSPLEYTIRLWDLTIGQETARLEGHRGGVISLALLSDGRLASAANDGTIRLWDVTTRQETARLEGHSSTVTALALLPDGRLASGSYETRVWDLATGKETARLEGHIAAVTALAVLPDGRLASGSGDNTIRLWDVTNCQEIVRLEVDDAVWRLAALPMAASLRAIGSADYTGFKSWSDAS